MWKVKARVQLRKSKIEKHQYPGTIEKVFSDEVIVKFDGKWIVGDIFGCSLLVYKDELEHLMKEPEKVKVDIWKEVDIQDCRCEKCFKTLLHISLFGRFLWKHPVRGYWEQSQEEIPENDENWVFYGNEKVAGPFSDLFEIEAWIGKFMKIDESDHAHINALMRKL